MKKIDYHSDPIQVKLYVKRFFENGNTIKPYLLPAIYSLFGKQPALDKDVSLSEYDCFIKFPLPERVFMQNGWMLNRQNTVVFNCLLEGYIKDRFEMELEANIRRSHRDEQKFSFRDMVNDLCVHYGFSEEDLPFQTIKKSLQRFCEREHIDIQSIKIYTKNVPLNRTQSDTSGEYIRSIDFCKALGISDRTYRRMKNERKQLDVLRIGRYDHVNINTSAIGAVFTHRTQS
jgi:hypothetical protein